MNAIPILGPPVWSPAAPGTLYVVTDLQRARVGPGMPVFVSEHRDRAVGVFRSHAPEFAECYEYGWTSLSPIRLWHDGTLRY
jgi:hypothetical protein